MKQKSIYMDGEVNSMIGLILFAGLMTGISLYMTQHYLDVRFPTGISSGSLCNINSYFNCSKHTDSPLSSIFSIPIALFGAIIGVLALMGMIFKNEDYERTIYFTLLVNFIGCVFLFLYSILIIHGLCPFCTLYYIFSGLLLYLFYKKSSEWKPNFAYLASFAITVAIIAFFMRQNVLDKEKTQSAIGNDLIKQYYSYPNLGTPAYPSIYKLASQNDAPIKMVIFSDFECPSCKVLSEEMPAIIEKYKGKIDISYYFYPLDNSCNPEMKRPLHQYACKAAFAATCMPSADFVQIHDVIFKNQDKLESGFIDQYIKDNKLEKCVADPATKEKVGKLISAAAPFNVASTPTFLVNGVKIEGALPLDQLTIIFDEILRRAGK